VIYGITNLNFYGISYSYDEVGWGFGYNSMLAGCVEMSAFLFLSKLFGVMFFRGIPLKRYRGGLGLRSFI
jgi:hypothetical protein